LAEDPELVAFGTTSTAHQGLAGANAGDAQADLDGGGLPGG
jgi:hypothetical protein